MRKLLKDDKINMVSLHRSGMKKADICRLYNIDKKNLSMILMSYDRYGLSGLDKQPHKLYSDLKKRAVLSDYGLKLLSLPEIAVKHRISLQTLKDWIRKDREGRLFVVKNRNQSRISMGKKQIEKEKKDIDKDKEELLRELKYLRTENALLKKVRALVEKKSRKKENGLQPSSH